MTVTLEWRTMVGHPDRPENWKAHGQSSEQSAHRHVKQLADYNAEHGYDDLEVWIECREVTPWKRWNT